MSSLEPAVMPVDKPPEPSPSTSNPQPIPVDDDDDDDIVFLGVAAPPPSVPVRNNEQRSTPLKPSARSKVNILQRNSKTMRPKDDQAKDQDQKPPCNVNLVYVTSAGGAPANGVPTAAKDSENIAVCCAKNCHSSPIASKMIFYTFPRDPELREKWIKALRTDNPQFTPLPHTLLCELHFAPSDFLLEGGNKVLRGGAIPRVFIKLKKDVACCVGGCRAKMDGKSPISFHRFPPDDELRKLWIKAANLKSLPDSSSFVCSSHFLPDFIVKSSFGVATLQKNAIPTIFPNHVVYLKPPSVSESTQLKMDVLKKIPPLASGSPLRLKIPRVSLKWEDKKRADEVLNKMSDEEYNELRSTIPEEERRLPSLMKPVVPSTGESPLEWKNLQEQLRFRLEACSTEISKEPPQKKIKKESSQGIPIIKLDLPSLIPQLTTVKTTSADPSQPVKHLAIVPLSQLKGLPVMGSSPVRLPATASTPDIKKQFQGPFKISKVPLPGQGQNKSTSPAVASSSSDPDHSYSSIADAPPFTPEMNRSKPVVWPVKAEQPGPRFPFHQTLVKKPKKGSDSGSDDSGDFSPSPPPSPNRIGHMGPIVGIERIDYLRKIYKSKMDAYRRKIKNTLQSKRRLTMRLQTVLKKLDQAEKNLKEREPLRGRKPPEQVIVLDTVPSCPCRRQKRLRMALLPPPREDLDSVLHDAVDHTVPDREESVEIVAENERLLKRIINIKQTLRNKDIVRCVMIEAEEIESLPS